MPLNPRDELKQFYFFLGRQIEAGHALSPEEALDEWRLMHPTSEQYQASVAAIQQAIDDMNAGDKGRPAEEVLKEIRREFGITD